MKNDLVQADFSSRISKLSRNHWSRQCISAEIFLI